MLLNITRGIFYRHKSWLHLQVFRDFFPSKKKMPVFSCLVLLLSHVMPKICQSYTKNKVLGLCADVRVSEKETHLCSFWKWHVIGKCFCCPWSSSPDLLNLFYQQLKTWVMCFLPSSVCWSSKTWFINLVFSSISTWFSMSPEMDKNRDHLHTTATCCLIIISWCTASRVSRRTVYVAVHDEELVLLFSIQGCRSTVHWKTMTHTVICWNHVITQWRW